MAIQEQQLGQVMPATTATSALVSDEGVSTKLCRDLIVCNTSTSALTFRIFYDSNGTNYDTSTAVFYDHPIGSKETFYEKVFWPLVTGSNASIGIRASAGNALTFTISGATIT